MRKQGGLCTGITQNVVDLLQNYIAMTLLSNSEFVALLKQANVDSAKLAESTDGRSNTRWGMFMMNGFSRRSAMDWHFIYSLWTMWKGREDHVSV